MESKEKSVLTCMLLNLRSKELPPHSEGSLSIYFCTHFGHWLEADGVFFLQ